MSTISPNTRWPSLLAGKFGTTTRSVPVWVAGSSPVAAPPPPEEHAAVAASEIASVPATSSFLLVPIMDILVISHGNTSKRQYCY